MLVIGDDGPGRGMATEPDPAGGEQLDGELAELLDVERFEPPPSSSAARCSTIQRSTSGPSATRRPGGRSQARELHWFEPWETVLDDSDPPFYRWFVGGTLNASYNCLDRHVLAGDGERVAYHWRGEEGQERDITYTELLAEVQRFAGALKDIGVQKGDVVGIYLPMIPEVVVAMLACARIGAPHNVVFGGFSAEAVRERMEFSDAKVLITVDGASRKGKVAAVKDRVDEVMDGLDALERIVVVRSKGVACPMHDGRDLFYDEILAAAAPQSALPSRSTPSIPSTSSTPQDRLPSPRGSCTRPAATSPWSRRPTASSSTSRWAVQTPTSTGVRRTSAG